MCVCVCAFKHLCGHVCAYICVCVHTCVTGEVAQHGIKVKIFDVIPGKAAGAVQELTDRLPELMRCGLIEKHCDFAVRPGDYPVMVVALPGCGAMV